MRAYLREADENDIDLLFQWVNDSAVRESAFSSEIISYSDHQKWYKKILDSDNYMQYIYMYDGEAVGQVRVTVVGNESELDYSICKEKRVMGHGKLLLQLVCRRIKVDFPDVQKVVAKVKPGNIASQHTFLSAGYTEKYSFFELDISDIDILKYTEEISEGGGIILN